jgi:hypothetical protein
MSLFLLFSIYHNQMYFPKIHLYKNPIQITFFIAFAFSLKILIKDKSKRMKKKGIVVFLIENKEFNMKNKKYILIVSFIVS